MLVVFYTVNIVYFGVFVTCCTSYCLCDILMDPWNVCVCVPTMNIILVYQVSASCNWYTDMNTVTAFHRYSFIFLKRFTFFHEISCLLCWSEVCGLRSGFLWHFISGIYANSFWVNFGTFNKSWDSLVSVVTRMWAEPEKWGSFSGGDRFSLNHHA